MGWCLGDVWCVVCVVARPHSKSCCIFTTEVSFTAVFDSHCIVSGDAAMIYKSIAIRDDTKQSDNPCARVLGGTMIHTHDVNADGDLALEGEGLDKHELKEEAGVGNLNADGVLALEGEGLDKHELKAEAGVDFRIAELKQADDQALTSLNDKTSWMASAMRALTPDECYVSKVSKSVLDERKMVAAVHKKAEERAKVKKKKMIRAKMAASEALDLAEREDKEKQKVCTYACMKTLI